ARGDRDGPQLPRPRPQQQGLLRRDHRKVLNMKLRNSLLGALAALALPAAAHEPAGPLLPLLDAAAIGKTCDAALEKARARVAAMEAKSGGQGFLAEWNELQVGMDDAISPISNLGRLHPDKSVRDAADPCLKKVTEYS